MEKIKANRNFANKLWNCCKFVTGNALNGLNDEELESLAVNGPMGKEEFDNLSLPEKYIISKCHELVAEVTRDIEGGTLNCSFLIAFLLAAPSVFCPCFVVIFCRLNFITILIFVGNW